MNTIITTISKLIAIPIISILTFAGYSIPTKNSVSVDLPKSNTLQVKGFNPSGGGTYRLRTSAASTDTTIQLSSFKEPVSNIPYTMSYLNTSVGYGTLDPQQPTKSEFISFTGITQNSDGTAILTGVTRGLSRSYPYTASSTLRQSHSGQSIFILSDSPQLFNEYAVKRNDETITGDWHAPTPATDNSIAIRSYVDGKVFGGIGNASETATGTVQIATALQTASSTTNGTLGRLVIPSSLATSTYNAATAGLKVVVTQNNGKIDQNFISIPSLSEVTLTGTTTIQATTTINGYVPQAVVASSSLSTSGSTSFSLSGINYTSDASRILIMASTTHLTGTSGLGITFNGDTNNDYIRYYGPDGSTTANPSLDIFGTYLSGGGKVYITIDVNNATGSPKYMTISGVFRNLTDQKVWATTTAAVWMRPEPINSITVTSVTANALNSGFIKVIAPTTGPSNP